MTKRNANPRCAECGAPLTVTTDRAPRYCQPCARKRKTQSKRHSNGRDTPGLGRDYIPRQLAPWPDDMPNFQDVEPRTRR